MHRHIHWQDGHVLPPGDGIARGPANIRNDSEVAKLSIKPIRRPRTTSPGATAAHLEQGGR